MTPKPRQKKKRDKLDFFKIKAFILQRTPSRKLKDNSQNEMKYLQIIYLRKDLSPEYVKHIYKEQLKNTKE